LFVKVKFGISALPGATLTDDAFRTRTRKLLKQCALKIVVPQQCDKELLEHSRSAFLDRRAKMIDKQRSENPSINHTDACRRAIYYLGIDQTDTSWEIGHTN